MNEIMDTAEVKRDQELAVPANDHNADLTVTVDGKRYEAEVLEVVQDNEDPEDR